MRQVLSVFIMTTSKGSASGSISELKEACIPGTNERIISVVSINMVCAECQKLSQAEQMLCKCEMYKRPAHLSDEREDEMIAFYKNNMRRYMIEFKNVDMEVGDMVMPREEIDFYMDPANYVDFTQSPGFLYFFVDPSGGGQSKMGVSVFAVANGVMVVCIYRLDIFVAIFFFCFMSLGAVGSLESFVI
jgi:hypothetical protein